MFFSCCSLIFPKVPQSSLGIVRVPQGCFFLAVVLCCGVVCHGRCILGVVGSWHLGHDGFFVFMMLTHLIMASDEK